MRGRPHCCDVKPSALQSEGPGFDPSPPSPCGVVGYSHFNLTRTVSGAKVLICELVAILTLYMMRLYGVEGNKIIKRIDLWEILFSYRKSVFREVLSL